MSNWIAELVRRHYERFVNFAGQCPPNWKLLRQTLNGSPLSSGLDVLSTITSGQFEKRRSTAAVAVFALFANFRRLLSPIPLPP